jgi:hypothetical protein
MRRVIAAALIVALLPSLLAVGATGLGSDTKRIGGWHPGVKAAKRYATGRVGDVRFSVIRIDGESRRFHAGRSAPMASLFKVMALAAYLRQGSVRDRPLTEGERDLLGPMIRRSDNGAATRVRDMLGPGPFLELARDADMKHFRYDSGSWGLSRTSARDQAEFMFRLEHYIPRRHEDYARGLLNDIVPSQRWGIADVRPNHWKLFFKGGWGSGSGAVDHQAAFLERKRCRIALAIITEGTPSHAYGKRTLRGVADRLFNGIQQANC